MYIDMDYIGCGMLNSIIIEGICIRKIQQHIYMVIQHIINSNGSLKSVILFQFKTISK